MDNFTISKWVRLLSLTLCSTLLFCLHLKAQTGPVNGRIFDSKSNEAVVGATVKVKGQPRSTQTDVNGKFTIDVSDGSVLQISYVGYTTKEVPASHSGAMSITIDANASNLDEVIVVAYGTQKKVTVTGAISTVSSKVFEDRGPTNNPIANLQGQVPGVVVTRTSAQPGRENWNFQIRGATSTNNQDPLIILDGVALNNNNALNSINPSDIESMSVLKDASAAIYGARAAYGVVLITTKRGKVGKMTVEYSPTVSRKVLGMQPNTLNLEQWATNLKQAIINDGYGLAPTTGSTLQWYQYADFALGNLGKVVRAIDIPGYNGSAITQGLTYNGLPVPQFNDVKEFAFTNDKMSDIFWGDATSTQHNLSFSGRTEKNGYRVSLGLLNDGSQLQIGRNGNQRYNIRMNHDYKFSDQVKVETNVALERNNIQQPTLYGIGTNSALATFFQPGIPAYTQSGRPYQWGGVVSPAGTMRDGGDNLESNSRILLNTTLTYNFLKHVSFSGTAGLNTWYQDQKIQAKQVQYFTYDDRLVVGTNPVAGAINNGAYYLRGQLTNPFYNLIGRVTYTNTFNKDHDVSAMIGSSYERDEYNAYSTTTYNLISDDVPWLGGGASSGTAGYVTNGESRNHTALGSYFARVTYAYKGKYLFEGTGRYDGSSKFISDTRWKAFYSLQGGWRLSEEGFIKKLNFFDELKIRGSYGVKGNQGGIGLYDYIQSLNVGASGTLLGSTIATQTATSGNLVSLTRTWENVKDANLGLDFAIFKGKLSGTFELFRKTNSNMLVNVTYPGVLGAGAPQTNDGKLQTWGWEGVLTYKDHIGGLNFSVSGNITDSQNKLAYLSGVSLISGGYNGTVEGYPLGSYFGLKYAGRLQTQAEVDAYNRYYAPGGVTNTIGLPIASPLTNLPGQNSGLRPGDNSFVDVNGDGKLTAGTSNQDLGDFVYLGSDVPRFTFGLNFGLQWKGFDFYSIFQGVGKRTIFRGGNANNWRVPYTAVGQNQVDTWLGDTWTPDNPVAFFPNLHSLGNNGINTYNYQASTWSVESGAYVRLKNLVIGYTIPKSILARTKALSGVRVYVSGSDLWEISKIHDGWDPEVTRDATGNQRYPFYRYLTLGANITF
jgi:TonB-linked SusC/RagA family outer membrane protein